MEVAVVAAVPRGPGGRRLHPWTRVAKTRTPDLTAATGDAGFAAVAGVSPEFVHHRGESPELLVRSIYIGRRRLYLLGFGLFLDRFAFIRSVHFY